MALNEELVSINASHAIYVNRLAVGLGNDAIPFVDKVNVLIEARLAREVGKNLTPLRREKLLEDIHAITADNLKDYTRELAVENREFGGYESGFQAKSVNGLLVNVETIPATTVAVNRAAKNTLITLGEGSYTTYNEMLGRYWKDNATQVTNIVANGFQSGLTTREIANQVMNEVGTRLVKSKKQAVILARTGTNHYGNQARKEYFEENDVIVGTRRIATLDSNTSGFCRGIDNTVVLKSDSAYRGAFAPFHRACRTANVPEVDARYSQDDDGGDRASNFRVDQKPAKDTASGKADKGSLDPKPVDTRDIYYESLRDLKKDDQNAILGPSLGKAYRKMLKDGGTPAEFAKLTIDEKHNKAYTLTQLKENDGVLADILNAQAK